MNHRMLRYVLFWILKIEGALLLCPALIGLIYRERAGLIYLGLGLSAILLGVLGSLRKPLNTELYSKDGFVTAGLTWLLLSLYGALPFVMTGEVAAYVDALFEIVSGFTTTGASILPDVEAMSHATLFWRSFSHWIGGMGVLVFLLMMLPVKTGSQMNLMVAESPGPDVSKFVPRVRNTARILYWIYLGMTLLQLVILMVSGMYWFDALCITFGTAGTGGFSVLNSGCASYTGFQQWVITLFMIAFGVNFSFYYLILTRRVRTALKMEEVRGYLLIILAAVGVITWNISSMYGSFSEAVRSAAFQVGSIITTTGYSTTDFDKWPELSRVILLMLMFCGACAGSTGGGIKVSRIILSFKSMLKELYSLNHPRSVKKIFMDDHVVDYTTMHTVYRFIATYFLIFVLSLLVITVDEFTFATNFSAVAATLNNIGPGLDMVGPTANFSIYSPLSKLVLCFDMLAGRLELFPILILLYPGTWRKR